MTTSQILQGDALSVLKTLESGSVQCCITSPPYFGLRDYGTAAWVGGDPDCDHKGNPMRTKANINTNCGTGTDVKNATSREFYKQKCGRCGAVREDDQIGLESTPQEYVTALVDVFREVRRVLKTDGIMFLNLGDSYASNWPCNRRNVVGTGSLENGRREARPPRGIGSGIKDKDLIGIPWRVAFALQEAGWYLRQDIIWAKPNPMPESVTDRCTKSHEYIFLLTKSRHYHYDHEAIKEPLADASIARLMQDVESQKGSDRVPGKTNGTMKAVGKGYDRINRDRPLPRNRNGITGSLDSFDGATRNKRSVWHVATQPSKLAHFATFPTKLIEPMVLAGSREGDTILDPFNGTGTTGLVALRNNRNYIGIELNPEYIEISEERLKDVQVRMF